jgi:murein L,D-transpeptidase YcbB/YkuD
LELRLAAVALPRLRSSLGRRVPGSGRLIGVPHLGILLALLFAPAGEAAWAQDPGTTEIGALIATARIPWSRWPDFPRYVDDVERLYRARADQPVWLNHAGVSGPGREALAQLAAAGQHGLDPVDYDVPTLDSLTQDLDRGPATAGERWRTDLLLSVAFLRFVDDLHRGRAHPASLSRSLPPPPLDLAGVVSAAVAGDSVTRLALAMAPPFAQYRNLRLELARYRALAKDSTLPTVPAATRVRPGDPYKGAPALARRLAALGDMPAEASWPDHEDRYAGDLVEAVRRFQQRHGLDAQGVIDPPTFAALNTPLPRRIRQIELALERLRWLPSIRGQRFLVVNIPAFQLFAFDSAGGVGAPALNMRVIVGKAVDTRTPVLVEQLRYLEFQPYWNVPRSILVGEILPQLRRRPRYLRDHGMELIGSRDRSLGDVVTRVVLSQLASGDVRVRQRPSPRNPLGRVKFVFPNAADVYLHGTPDTALFARQRRDFSHGCIRVEVPAALAWWVLRDQPAWTRDSVDAAMAAKPTRRVLLSRPMPVILFYTTAVAVPGRGVAFYDDIYGHDRRLDEALRAGPTPP